MKVRFDGQPRVDLRPGQPIGLLLLACLAGAAFAQLATQVFAGECGRMASAASLSDAASAMQLDPSVLSYFPADFAASRERFNAACRAARQVFDGECGPPYPISSPALTPGKPDGLDLSGQRRADPDLSIDVAYFRSRVPGSKRLLVIVSGNHGSEARPGAAIQLMALEWDKHHHLARLLDRGIDVYLIHSLNPWGYKHYRRTDACNVNLNRAFVSRDRQGVYRAPNQDYQRFKDLFAPTGPVRSDAWDSIATGAGFLKDLLLSGFNKEALNKGMNTGQYQDPQGLNYGGTENPKVSDCEFGGLQQRTFLERVLKPLMAQHRYRGQKILILDVHTGLGDAAVLSLIKGISPPKALMDETERMIADHTRDGIVVRSSESPGFFSTTGDLIDYTPTLAPEDRSVLAVTAEYGTQGTDAISQIRSAARMILENQAYFYGCSSADACAAVEANFRELFDPSDEAWRLKVLTEADLLLSLIERQF